MPFYFKDIAGSLFSYLLRSLFMINNKLPVFVVILAVNRENADSLEIVLNCLVWECEIVSLVVKAVACVISPI